VGEAALRPGSADGAVDGISWELRFEGGEPPLFHLPRDWMYGAPLPRTKLLSPVPAARFDGSVSADGRTVAVDGWPGMIGHNWGAQHAERWIWLHGEGPSGDWLDAALGRIKLGPLTTPWIGNGVISLGGVRHTLGGPGRRLRVSEAPDRCDFVLPGAGLRVRGTVSAARKDVVGWVYADPDGSEHHTTNCSIADLGLTVERKGAASVQLRVPGGSAGRRARSGGCRGSGSVHSARCPRARRARRFPRREPGARARASGRGGRRAGWPRAPWPCGCRSSCRTRSRVRRSPC
jgi:hypothetical protein